MNCLHFKYTFHIPVKSYSTKTHSIPHHQSINKKQQNISYPNVTPALRYCVSQVKYQGNQQCTARTNKRWNDACSVIQVSAYSSGQDCTLYSHLQASGHFNWWGYTQIFLAQLHLLKTIPCFILLCDYNWEPLFPNKNHVVFKTHQERFTEVTGKRSWGQLSQRLQTTGYLLEPQELPLDRCIFKGTPH